LRVSVMLFKGTDSSGFAVQDRVHASNHRPPA
jgi:hypothetical protein